MLESLDREIAFYRKRSGQVFFLGISFEIAILAGGRQLPDHDIWPWLPFLTITFLFYAVAATSVVLGSEYRRRIRTIKNNRSIVILQNIQMNPFPTDNDQVVSEIQVLYVVLITLSLLGIFFTWLYIYSSIVLLYGYYLFLGATFILSLYYVFKCLFRKVPVLT